MVSRYRTRKVLFSAAAVLGGAVLIGTLTGWFWPVLAIFATSWLAWNLWQLIKLQRWLKHPGRVLPDSFGIWGDLFHDIYRLQRKQASQKRLLERVLSEFQQASAALPDATVILDRRYNIRWFNETARQLLGLRPEDVGQQITNLFRDPDFIRWLDLRNEIQAPLEVSSPQDSARRLSISAVAYQRRNILLLARDITDMSRVEQVRRDFVANVSHELRTPLTVFIGYLESLDGSCPEDIQPVISRLHDQAKTMHELVLDLLELAQLQEGEQARSQEQIDVAAMVAQIREQAEEFSRGRHRIHLEVDRTLQLRGSEQDLRSAFRNIVNNAVRYTPDGGEIWLRWFGDPRHRGIFEVRDTGIGIASRDIPRLTERFFRVGSDRARTNGGTGLGLSIVKHVLNAHQAKLEIESEPGEGSRFRCVFSEHRTVEVEPASLSPAQAAGG